MEAVLDIDEERIRAEFIRKPWIKNSYLRFQGERLIVVSRNGKLMDRLVASHRRWIAKHYRQVRDSIRLFGENSLFYIDGVRNARCQISESAARPRVEILEGGVIVHAKSPEAAERALDRMIIRTTESAAAGLAKAKAQLIGKHPSQVRARRYRKWGMCSASGSISVNYCMCLLPKELQDYIVSHEVAHLKEMNHSARFWGTVSLLCPEYRRLRNELKRYDNSRNRVFGEAYADAASAGDSMGLAHEAILPGQRQVGFGDKLTS